MPAIFKVLQILIVVVDLAKGAIGLFRRRKCEREEEEKRKKEEAE